MPRYVAFLRGINVGGHRVTGDQIRSHFAGLGFYDVAAFRASGNVIFSAERGGRVDAIAARIEKGLAPSLGYEVPTFLRADAQVKAIAAHSPFASDVVKASGGKLQVLLLSAAPPAQKRKKVLAMASEEDRLAIVGQELYWLPSGGISDSALDLKAIERLAGPTTIRTKGTIEQIAAKYFTD